MPDGMRINRQHREALDKTEARLAKLAEDSDTTAQDRPVERLTTLRYEGKPPHAHHSRRHRCPAQAAPAGPPDQGTKVDGRPAT